MNKIYDRWVSSSKEKNGTFIDLVNDYTSVKERRYTDFVALFGLPDQIKDKVGEMETHDCYYFYSIILGEKSYDMFVWIGVKNGNIIGSATNERRHLPLWTNPEGLSAGEAKG